MSWQRPRWRAFRYSWGSDFDLLFFLSSLGCFAQPHIRCIVILQRSSRTEVSDPIFGPFVLALDSRYVQTSLYWAVIKFICTLQTLRQSLLSISWLNGP